jgi:hypothetical protein
VKIPPVVSQVEPPLKTWRNDGGKIHHTARVTRINPQRMQI